MKYYIELIKKQQKEKVNSNISLFSFVWIYFLFFNVVFVILLTHNILEPNCNPAFIIYIIADVILLGLTIFGFIDTIKSISKYKKIISKLEKE